MTSHRHYFFINTAALRLSLRRICVRYHTYFFRKKEIKKLKIQKIGLDAFARKTYNEHGKRFP